MGLGSHGICVLGHMFFPKIPKSRDCPMGLESQAVSRILAVPKSSHWAQIPGTLWTGTKIVGTVPGFSALGLKSQGQKSLGLAVPSHAHPCSESGWDNILSPPHLVAPHLVDIPHLVDTFLLLWEVSPEPFKTRRSKIDLEIQTPVSYTSNNYVSNSECFFTKIIMSCPQN